MLFPAHYDKVVKCGRMTCGVTVVMNRGGGFHMFLKPLSKCSSCLTYVLLITLQPITFEYKAFPLHWDFQYIKFHYVNNH